MLKRLTSRQRGFTLIELLIVVAIIGIIAALLVPNFIDALQKAKQKRTVGDERDWGVAAMSWLTDQVGAASAGQGSNVNLDNFSGTHSYTEIRLQLVPQYIQEMPENDGWKNAFAYGLDIEDPLRIGHITMVCSFGRDGESDTPVTGSVGTDCGGDFVASPFDPTDYQQDIVWTDGYFVRWPEKLNPAN